MLIVFVALFLFCQLPNLVLHVLRAVNLRMNDVKAHSYLTQWANFLLIVNSTFNFPIYCLISQSFRKQARKIFSWLPCLEKTRTASTETQNRNYVHTYRPVASTRISRNSTSTKQKVRQSIRLGNINKAPKRLDRV